jgi:hypothetical protein
MALSSDPVFLFILILSLSRDAPWSCSDAALAPIEHPA